MTEEKQKNEDILKLNLNGVDITIAKNKNYSLEELYQKLINYIYNRNTYSSCDIEIIKILFEKKD